ncbi:hypothetical protein KA977_15190 [Candidatus Dependentiae bacterium]|nr:hypothetical protein [Candidatus Dependentiae bacterium]
MRHLKKIYSFVLLFINVFTAAMLVYFHKAPLNFVNNGNNIKKIDKIHIKNAFRIFKAIKIITGTLFFFKWTCYNSSLVKYYLAGNGALFLNVYNNQKKGHCEYFNCSGYSNENPVIVFQKNKN